MNSSHGAIDSIIGIDEAGRGAWAGPLVGAAVLLQGNIDGLKDSKLLGAEAREELYPQIIQNSTYAIIAYDVAIINELGVHKANLKLFRALANAITERLPAMHANRLLVIFDGYRPSEFRRGLAITQGDVKIAAISAASILAKVHRDRVMCGQIAPQYPDYRFDLHKGYGTRLHQEVLSKLGPTKVHRANYKPIIRLNDIFNNNKAAD